MSRMEHRGKWVSGSFGEQVIWRNTSQSRKWSHPGLPGSPAVVRAAHCWPERVLQGGSCRVDRSPCGPAVTPASAVQGVFCLVVTNGVCSPSFSSLVSTEPEKHVSWPNASRMWASPGVWSQTLRGPGWLSPVSGRVCRGGACITTVTLSAAARPGIRGVAPLLSEPALGVGGAQTGALGSDSTPWRDEAHITDLTLLALGFSGKCFFTCKTVGFFLRLGGIWVGGRGRLE